MLPQPPPLPPSRPWPPLRHHMPRPKKVSMDDVLNMLIDNNRALVALKDRIARLEVELAAVRVPTGPPFPP